MSAPDDNTPLPEPTDEELVRALADGRHEALKPLYRRYESKVRNMAARALDRSVAEEIAQDVFLAVWRRATVFTAERGTFRSWIQQIARYRILNELRRRGRRPQVGADPDGLLLSNVPDDSPEVDDMACRESLYPEVRSALEALSSSQREVLDLAYFKDLTHTQVAAELHIPLGTAKTRIRAGLRVLRRRLAPVVAGPVGDRDSHLPPHSPRAGAGGGPCRPRYGGGRAFRPPERGHGSH